MNNKQFTFKTSIPESNDGCSIVKIKEYYLQHHQNLNYTYSNHKNTTLHLLGNVFDYIDTKASNQELVDTLIKQQTKEDVFKILDTYYGEYVLIYATEKELIILNDCCAQHEVYYTDDYTEVGSQLHLLSNQNSVKKDHIYYDSALFNKKKLCIGTTTPSPQVKHLAPNHYIDVLHKKTIRFFPNEKITPQPIEAVAKKVALMLKGYITAIANRHKIVLPVTGGFDSRLLFLASLDTECDYFVSQHPNMSDDHYDITIAQKITDIFDKKLHVIKDADETNHTLETTQNIDNPRTASFPKLVANKVLINGNISEIARNYYNYIQPVTAKKLTLLNGYSDNAFVIDTYQNWLSQNKGLFKKQGYHILDLFYWEEKMGNWTAKAKTEAHAMNLELMSPFNSRALLQLLLSTKRKDRDKFTSTLYQKIIEHLVDNHKEINAIPTNPDFERSRALFLKKIKLFKAFDAFRLYVRILKRKF
ncbi:MAG: hypothetical protein ACI9Y7_000863 [Dokdonia sp.]|jgi:hypothetical protein